MAMEEPSAANGFCAAHVMNLLRSYRALLGVDLIDPARTDKATARQVFEAPFAVLSHGTEVDPVLNYVNRYVMSLWEADWPTLTSMPSRLTAEQMERAARAEFMAQTAAQGFVRGYTGIRISASGQRFRIIDAVIWNVQDIEGRQIGQAASFARIERLK